MNQSAGGREGIDAVGVEDDELPLEIGAAARLGEDSADQGYVLRERLVLEDAELGAHAGANTIAEVALFLFRDAQLRDLLGLSCTPLNLPKLAELRERRRRPEQQGEN